MRGKPARQDDYTIIDNNFQGRLTKMINDFGFRTLLDIAPDAFAAARESVKREEREYMEIIGLIKGRIKRCIKEEGVPSSDSFEREKELMESMGLRDFYAKCDIAADAYHDLVRPIGNWKYHVFTFSGWTGLLFDCKVVTLNDVCGMLKGTECCEKDIVTLEDGRVFRSIKGDEGYYSGDDGSVIAGIDLIRTDKDGNPVKVECRLGYVVVSGAGSYDGMPH